MALLLDANVAGYKLKPFLIYRCLNPRAFRNVNKHALPVFYRANLKAWMTQALFEEWFLIALCLKPDNIALKMASHVKPCFSLTMLRATPTDWRPTSICESCLSPKRYDINPLAYG